jgi:fido (protein-threonine AMPylation protein)
MVPWTPNPGETPIDDISGLKVKGIQNRRELNLFEAANIRKAFVKYLAARPSRRLAPFDFSWSLRLHAEMFGDVWSWAGKTRRSDKTIGVPSGQVESMLHQLMGDLEYWENDGFIARSKHTPQDNPIQKWNRKISSSVTFRRNFI